LSPELRKVICYDTTLSVNPDHFSGHTLSHADIYYRKTRSVFLSYQLETPYYSLRYDAVEVEERKLDDREILFPAELRIR
jgi:hypothetical protein